MTDRERKNRMNIAIDGPAGAGKSTVAKRLAKELGYVYVDTGAMYRAMALYFLEAGIPASSEEEISKRCEEAGITICYQDGEQQVILNGKNVNGAIRTEEVGNMASSVSVYPKVRERLVALQQDLASRADVVMDGRDIGTCVLPDAEVKVYLTASVKARAGRRYQELLAKGVSCDLTEIQKDIEERDYRDMHRDASPLRQAPDAILVDSSGLGIEEVIDAVKRICKRKAPSHIHSEESGETALCR